VVSNEERQSRRENTEGAQFKSMPSTTTHTTSYRHEK
jgi:hypothetical protein